MKFTHLRISVTRGYLLLFYFYLLEVVEIKESQICVLACLVEKKNLSNHGVYDYCEEQVNVRLKYFIYNENSRMSGFSISVEKLIIKN